MATVRLGAASSVRAFQSLSSALAASDSTFAHLIEAEALSDEFGRFRVWSGNLGALQKGHSSLDYRLRDSPLLFSNAVKLLKELEENLSEALAIVSGTRLPYEQQSKSEDRGDDDDNDDFFSEDEDDGSDASSSKTELEMRFAEIVDIVDNLYKLSVRIRTPTIRSRSLKASSYQPKDAETGLDILEQYAAFDLQHTQELFRYLRTPQIGDAITAGEDYLIERLSGAITLRRRQFKYWRRHRDKLGMFTVFSEDPPLAQHVLMRPDPPERHNTTEVQLSQSVVTATKELLSQRTGKTMLSGTEATAHHQTLDEIVADAKSVTSYATTVHDLHGRGIELPPPPKAADGEKDFECPYCFVICPARYGRGRAWKTHMLQDLQPYVCTYPDCKSHEQLWRSRREWVEHEACHRKAWRCPEHPAAIYGTCSGLEDHLRRKHSDSLPEGSLGTIIKVSETTTVDLRKQCPICLAPADSEGLGGLQNHIANHLERFATFALPIVIDDDADGESGIASLGRTSSGLDTLSEVSFESDTTLDKGQTPPESTIEPALSSPLEDQLAVAERGDNTRENSQLLSVEALQNIPDSSQRRMENFLAGTNDESSLSEDTIDQGPRDAEEEVAKHEAFRSHMLSLPGAKSCRFFRRYGAWKGHVVFNDEAAVSQALEAFDYAQFPDVNIQQGSERRTLLKFFVPKLLPQPGRTHKSHEPKVLPTNDAEESRSISSMSLPYDETDGQVQAPILSVSEIPNLRSLYQTQKLQQRDQSYASSVSYNQIISFCFHDITRLKVDAIVNSANKSMRITRTSDSLNHYVHRQAGRQLKKECKAAGSVKVGQVVLTSGSNLPAAHVIHAARPSYYSKGMGKFNLLAECYRSALKMAVSHGFRTIAFPSLAAGGCGFPSRVATRTALQEVREFLDAHPDHGLERIIFCVFSGFDEQAYVDFLPVFFPPTHRDLETPAAVELPNDKNRAVLASRLSDICTQVELLSGELMEFSENMRGFPGNVFKELNAIISAIRSLCDFLYGPTESIRNLRGRTVLDIELIHIVLQTICGSVTEMVELAKGSQRLDRLKNKQIWDDFNFHMETSQGFDLVTLLEICQDFVQSLEDIIVRNGTEPYEMATMRLRLGSYRLIRTGKGDKATRDHFDEIMYTREFQQEAIKPNRTGVVKAYQIPPITRLYHTGELEKRETNAIPSYQFNHTVCLLREDITRLEVDIIVNSTDVHFKGMGTIDRSIFQKGGLSMQEDCAKFGVGIEGEVKMTSGYLLPAKTVLHVIPPQTYRRSTKDVLRKIYREILHTAEVLKATSVAIPAIGTGTLNYPKRDCASLAMEEVKRFLESADLSSSIEKIIFVVFGSNDEHIYRSLLPLYFPPLDLNVNRALPAGKSVAPPAPAVEASDSSVTTPPPRRSLFSSIGEAFRSVRFGKQPVTQTARPLNSVEKYALTGFESHARGCPTCINIAKLYAERKIPCADGYAAAQLVLKYLYMEADRSVYSMTFESGSRVRVEVPTEYPLSWNLLISVEKSYRDDHRNRPFVSPNEPYSEAAMRNNELPPGVTIYSAEVTIPARNEPEKAVATVHTAFGTYECHLDIYPGRLEVWDADPLPKESTDPSPTDPLLSLGLVPSVLLEKQSTTEITLDKAGGVGKAQYRTRSQIRFESRDPAESELLLHKLGAAVMDGNAIRTSHDALGVPEHLSWRNEDTGSLHLPESRTPYLSTSDAEGNPLQTMEYSGRLREDGLASSTFGLPPTSYRSEEELSTSPSLLSQKIESLRSRFGDMELEYSSDRSSNSALPKRILAYLSAAPQSSGASQQELADRLDSTFEDVALATKELEVLGLVRQTDAGQLWAATEAAGLLQTVTTQDNLDLSISGLSTVNIDDLFTYLDLALDPQIKPFSTTGGKYISRAHAFGTFTSPESSAEATKPDIESQGDIESQVHHPRPTTPDYTQPQPIPSGARWTKIDRRLVNPQALKEANEDFEEREDSIVVFKVLTRAEITKLAERTRDIRRGKRDNVGKTIEGDTEEDTEGEPAGKPKGTDR